MAVKAQSESVLTPGVAGFLVPCLQSQVKQPIKSDLRPSPFSPAFLAQAQHPHASHHPDQTLGNRCWLVSSLQGYSVYFLLSYSTDPWLVSALGQVLVNLPLTVTVLFLPASRHVIYSTHCKAKLYEIQSTHVALLLQASMVPIIPRKEPRLPT